LAGKVPVQRCAVNLRESTQGRAEADTQRTVMSHAFVTLIAASMLLCASVAITQSAKDVRGPSPLIAIENEAPAKLIVDPPLPEPLSRGLVFIQYRTENLRVVPVFGKGALDVSPRIGLALCRRQWRNVNRGGSETWPTQGLDRAGRSHPPSNHQRDSELHLARSQIH